MLGNYVTIDEMVELLNFAKETKNGILPFSGARDLFFMENEEAYKQYKDYVKHYMYDDENVQRDGYQLVLDYKADKDDFKVLSTYTQTRMYKIQVIPFWALFKEIERDHFSEEEEKKTKEVFLRLVPLEKGPLNEEHSLFIYNGEIFTDQYMLLIYWKNKLQKGD